MEWINEKVIDNKLYTAYRDVKNPAKQFIVCEEVKKPCRLKDVWNDDIKITNLFK